ncbi:MAG: roadblock/LC7 domain-containing protein [Gemmatimonadota bacterium]|nr:MAG: roadblock/LC7 domain-containing protein [Gemmatimonadota bacterium]
MDRPSISQIQDAFAEPLEAFVRESNVRLAVLINRAGQVLAQYGFDKVFDLVGVASLAAGINASSRALANQLGEERFEHLHHAGPARQLFLGHFESAAGQLMLVTVFDQRSSIGLVRLFFERFVSQLRQLPSMDASRSAVSGTDFEAELETSLDRFFQDLVSG